MSKPLYYYLPGTDGCDETFDVYGPAGYLASVCYWHEEGRAERRAALMVTALNAYGVVLEERP